MSRLKTRAIRFKKFVFFEILFTAFPFFYAKEQLLLLLFTKERLWAICSGRLWQKNDGSNLLFFMSQLLFHSQKTRELHEKPMSQFPTLRNSPMTKFPTLRNSKQGLATITTYCRMILMIWLSFPTSHLACILVSCIPLILHPPVLHPSCPASLLSCIPLILHPCARDNLRGQKSLCPLKKSLEMAQKVIVPQKNIMSRIFLNSGTLIVILSFSTIIATVSVF